MDDSIPLPPPPPHRTPGYFHHQIPKLLFPPRHHFHPPPANLPPLHHHHHHHCRHQSENFPYPRHPEYDPQRFHNRSNMGLSSFRPHSLSLHPQQPRLNYHLHHHHHRHHHYSRSYQNHTFCGTHEH